MKEVICTQTDGNEKYELIVNQEEKFYIEIRRSNPYFNHDYFESMHLDKDQAKQLRDRLDKFLGR